VAPPEFFFTLEFSSQGTPTPLVQELSDQVCRFVGCPEASLAKMSEALDRATAATAVGPRRCDVQFRAHGGKLDVLVTANAGRVWQETIVIP
jgi:hypothetical protein